MIKDVSDTVNRDQSIFGRTPDKRGSTAHIAQLAEHALGKGEVSGSSPLVGSSANNSKTLRTHEHTKVGIPPRDPGGN